MKEIKIKYRNGSYIMNKLPKSNFSLSQARQLLEQIQGELKSFAGNYVWTLEGDTFDGYHVFATYTDCGGGYFHESYGKTPSKALLSCNAIKHVLTSLNLLSEQIIGEYS